MTSARFPVPVDEAVALLRKHAWTEHQQGCEHCDHVCGPPPRTRIHTTNGFGADWDLEGAVEFVEAAVVIGWRPNLMRHHLAARDAEGRTIHFDVPAPAEIKDKLDDLLAAALFGEPAERGTT